jgi:hypothetical protein
MSDLVYGISDREGMERLRRIVDRASARHSRRYRLLGERNSLTDEAMWLSARIHAAMRALPADPEPIWLDPRPNADG